jgi:hypothetical protein
MTDGNQGFYSSLEAAREKLEEATHALHRVKLFSSEASEFSKCLTPECRKRFLGAVKGMETSIDSLASRTLPETMVDIENIILYFKRPL